jgi:hypothetical protein
LRSHGQHRAWWCVSDVRAADAKAVTVADARSDADAHVLFADVDVAAVNDAGVTFADTGPNGAKHVSAVTGWRDPVTDTTAAHFPGHVSAVTGGDFCACTVLFSVDPPAVPAGMREYHRLHELHLSRLPFLWGHLPGSECRLQDHAKHSVADGLPGSAVRKCGQLRRLFFQSRLRVVLDGHEMHRCRLGVTDRLWYGS